jgi:hypothetical protein
MYKLMGTNEDFGKNSSKRLPVIEELDEPSSGYLLQTKK